MKFLSIQNPRFIEETNTLIDLSLLADEGTLPYTYHPDDPAPACQWIKEHIDLSTVAPFVLSLEDVQVTQKELLLTQHDALVAEGLVTDVVVEGKLFHAKLDDTSVSMWQVASQYPASTYPLIKDWNNQKYLDVPMVDIEMIAYQVLGYRTALWLRLQRLEMLVDNAQTPEAVKAINWETEV